MAKFGVKKNNFARVASYGGEIMMVLAVHDNLLVPRYDLRAINGTTYKNIGEYELTKATDAEVKAALK